MDPDKAMDLAKQLVEKDFDVTVVMGIEGDRHAATVKATTPPTTMDVLRGLVVLVDDEWRQEDLTVELPSGRLDLEFK